MLGDKPKVLRKDVWVTSVFLVTQMCTQQVFIDQVLILVGGVASLSGGKGEAQSPGVQ